MAVTTPGSEPRQRRPARRGLGVGVVVVAAGKAVFTVGGLARAESEGVPAGGSGSGRISGRAVATGMAHTG